MIGEISTSVHAIVNRADSSSLNNPKLSMDTRQQAASAPVESIIDFCNPDYLHCILPAASVCIRSVFESDETIALWLSKKYLQTSGAFHTQW